MDDPYIVLGVPKTATPEQIKHAWRKRAHAAHPDKGGDAGAMQALSVAYGILSDPAKREQYDKNGTVLPITTPDDKARGWLTALLMQFVQQELDVDVIGSMRQAVAAKITEVNQNTAAVKRMQEALRRRLKKLKGPPDNFLAHAIAASIKQIDDKIEGAAGDLMICARAQEILKDYEYDWLEVPQHIPGAVGFTVVSW